MIEGKRVLAVIPARGGSKGVPRKNIRILAGKPLLAWTIEETKRSKYIDRLVLSSEDVEIIEAAKSFGCEVPFIRPPKLAEDNTPGIDPILHALKNLPGYDIVLVLQPTSPLRKSLDIDEGLEFFERYNASICVSISGVSQNPYWMFLLDDHHHIRPVTRDETINTRRQDLPKVYMPNGALFIASTEYLQEKKSFYTKDTTGFIMPKERSYDIDDELDFIICEYLLNKVLKTL